MSVFQITLTTIDAQQVQFDCASDEDIISAAERQHIILPQQCRTGACGFCTASTVSGEFELKNYNVAALSDEQRANQQTLLCKTYPRSALEVHAAYPYGSIQFGEIPHATFTIVSKTMVTDNVLHLVLTQSDDMDNLLSANIVAGQYMQLMSPDGATVRAYSLACPSNWEGRLEFYIQLWPDGEFSQFLRQASEGDAVIARGPQGQFALSELGLKPRWFIGGGTGIAPLLAMLRQLAEFGDPLPARLLVGARHAPLLFAHEQYDELKQQLADFEYQLCLSQPPEDWSGHHGSVVQALNEALQNGLTEMPEFYLCGSERLVNGLLTVLDEAGVDRSLVFFERFAG